MDNGFRIVKLFLNLSKEEQRQRYLARIDEPEKNWKFFPRPTLASGSTGTSTRWPTPRCSRTRAPNGRRGTLSATSTEWAPWYVIPADHKWFARLGRGGRHRERADPD